jgi:hypothetical protein
LAARVVRLEDDAKRKSSATSWFRQQAAAMEIELDEACVDEVEADPGRGKRGRPDVHSTAKELSRAQAALAGLLARPARSQRKEIPRVKPSRFKVPTKSTKNSKNSKETKKKRDKKRRRK